MTIFKNKGQITLLPVIGIAKEELKATTGIFLVLVWLCYGISIRILEYK